MAGILADAQDWPRTAAAVLAAPSPQEPGSVMAGVSLVRRSRQFVRQNGTIGEMPAVTVPQNT